MGNVTIRGLWRGPVGGKNGDSAGTKERVEDVEFCFREHISLLAEEIALEVSNFQRGEFYFELLTLAHRHNAWGGFHKEGRGNFIPLVRGAVQSADRVQCALAKLVFLRRTWGQNREPVIPCICSGRAGGRQPTHRSLCGLTSSTRYI